MNIIVERSKQMKKMILPKKSMILTEEETKNIEGGADLGTAQDVFTMAMNRFVTLIGNVLFDPLDVINRRIRNFFNPYASESVPVNTNVASNNSDDRTPLV